MKRWISNISLINLRRMENVRKALFCCGLVFSGDECGDYERAYYEYCNDCVVTVVLKMVGQEVVKR